MIKKIMLVSFIILILFYGGFCVYKSGLSNANAEKLNICQDNELVVQLIEKNVNPFSKFKFMKKRSADCKELLIQNSKDALQYKKTDNCSVLDDSKVSTVMLIHLYVNELYDRHAASDELNSVVPLMTPYNHCPQYFDNMMDLVKIKKKMAL